MTTTNGSLHSCVTINSTKVSERTPMAHKINIHVRKLSCREIQKLLLPVLRPWTTLFTKPKLLDNSLYSTSTKMCIEGTTNARGLEQYSEVRRREETEQVN